jgi:hypothetical protein
MSNSLLMVYIQIRAHTQVLDRKSMIDTDTRRRTGSHLTSPIYAILYPQACTTMLARTIAAEIKHIVQPSPTILIVLKLLSEIRCGCKFLSEITPPSLNGLLCVSTLAWRILLSHSSLPPPCSHRAYLPKQQNRRGMIPRRQCCH